MADQTQVIGNAAARSGWRPWAVPSTGFEYLRAPDMVGGHILWQRSTRTWMAELVGLPPKDVGVFPPLVMVGGFTTPLAAQEWVEAGWHAVNAQYPNN